jgi:iron(III) transport system permease protein
VPLAYLLIRTVGAGWPAVGEILLRERTAVLLLRSLSLAGVVTATSLVIGVGWAWAVTRTSIRGRRVWLVVGALPLAMPSYLAAYAWISVAPSLPSFAGSVLVLTLVCYPYVLLPVAAALSRADPAAEDVARSLGRGRLATFVTVTLRQVRPAAVAGALLVALYVLSDFGAVALLRLDTFTRVIYTSYRAGFDPVPAAVLSLVLVAVTGIIAAAELRTRGRARHARLGSGVARTAVRVDLGPGAGAGVQGAMAAVTALALGVPLGTVGWWLTGSSGVDLGSVTGATLATVGLAIAAAAVTTLVAVPVGVLAARYRTGFTIWVERLSYIGFALPGIVVALSLVYLGVRVVYPLYQTTTMLLVAYTVLFLPMAVGAVRSAVVASPPVLEEVARSLGRRPWQAFVAVTLPAVMPGVLAGAALVAVTVMKELPATLVLRPTGTDTLATQLWSATAAGAYAGAAPYAAALVLVAIIPAALLAARTEVGRP